MFDRLAGALQQNSCACDDVSACACVNREAELRNNTLITCNE